MKKVFLVDDESLLCEWLAFNIRAYSDQYTVAGSYRNGRDAWNAVRRDPPDLLITDIKMPVMDGLELVRRIKEQFPQILCVVLTSFADFHYARELLRHDRVEYLLKSEIKGESLVAALDALAARYPAKIPPDAKEAETPVQISSLSEDPFETLGWFGLTNSEPFVAIAAHNGTVLRTICQTIGSRVRRLIDWQGAIVVLANRRALFPEGEQRLMTAACNAETQVGLSEFLIGGEQIANACDQARSALESAFFLEKSVLHCADRGTLDSGLLERSFTRIQLLAGQKDWAQASAEQQSLFALLQGAGCMDLALVQLYCRKLLLFWQEQCLLLALSPQQTPEPNQLSSFARRTESLLQLCAKVPPRSKSNMIEDAVRYLQANYAQELSLTEVAERFKVSPEHFSRTFKREMGDNFVNYLMLYRLSRAKELFETTDLKVSEIAELVGYRNTGYFSKLYKKYVGKTVKQRK